MSMSIAERTTPGVTGSAKLNLRNLSKVQNIFYGNRYYNTCLIDIAFYTKNTAVI